MHSARSCQLAVAAAMWVLEQEKNLVNGAVAEAKFVAQVKARECESRRPCVAANYWYREGCSYNGP